jgi:hypothetical protein
MPNLELSHTVQGCGSVWHGSRPTHLGCLQPLASHQLKSRLLGRSTEAEAGVFFSIRKQEMEESLEAARPSNDEDKDPEHEGVESG